MLCALVLMLATLAATAKAASTQSAPALVGGVVSSKEWKVRRAPQKEEEFIGDVRYRSKATLLTADWALFKHASQTWQVRGRVHVRDRTRSGDILEADGEQASFDQVSGKGTLTGQAGVHFKRSTDWGEPDFGRATRLNWQGKNSLSAVGLVRISGPRLMAWADRGDYQRSTGELTLTGRRPVVLKLAGFDPSSSDWIGAVQGDSITTYETPRRITADGKVKGWLNFAKPGSKADANP